MSGPLEGIKVIDVSAVVSGPLAAMILGDQGADVIKVEPPGIGEVVRLPNFGEAASPHYSSTAIATKEVWRSIFQILMALRLCMK